MADDGSAFKPCKCLIYSCASQKDLIAGHRYCHGLYNKMQSNSKGDFKYTMQEVIEEHARIVRCMKRNGYKHETPL